MRCAYKGDIPVCGYPPDHWMHAAPPAGHLFVSCLADNEALKDAVLDEWYTPAWRKWPRPPAISRDAITKAFRIIDEHLGRGQR